MAERHVAEWSTADRDRDLLAQAIRGGSEVPSDTTCVASGDHADCIPKSPDGGTADAAHTQP
jgi:hypothetical protein